MLLDIHTHRNAAVPGECIFNVEPAWFEPVEGCYYSVGIHPWKVLEAGPEDWTTLEKAVCHPSVLASVEACPWTTSSPCSVISLVDTVEEVLAVLEVSVEVAAHNNAVTVVRTCASR